MNEVELEMVKRAHNALCAVPTRMAQEAYEELNTYLGHTFDDMTCTHSYTRVASTASEGGTDE